MHVLLFNLKMDAEDPVLGFASRWVDAIAERVDQVSVVTMTAGAVRTRPNVEVWSVGKERGLNEAQRVGVFYRHCMRILRGSEVDACFSHMIPVFSILFAPLARRHRIPTLLWYAHGAVPWDVRVAERVVDRCVTSAPEGFRLASSKLHVLQQGIETSRLRVPEDRPPDWGRTVVSVGRVGPVKRLEEIVAVIAAARDRGLPLRWEIFGAPGSEADAAYQRRVEGEVERRGLQDEVCWRGPLPHERIGEAFGRGAFFLNLRGSGSLDKAILESMACGCLPVSDNDAFAAIARREGWEHLVPGGSAAAAADALIGLASMPASEQAATRAQLRDFVVREHALEDLADRIVSHLRDLAVGNSGR